MTDHNETTKAPTEVRLADWPSAVMVPDSVVSDPKLSLGDLGLYVKLASLLPLLVSPCTVDVLMTQLLYGAFGQRVDVDDQTVRAGIQRLIEAGHLEVPPPRSTTDDLGAF